MKANNLLHLATEIACEAHKGQSDKRGEPYIFHVMRVALACEGDARLAALLHDVVEDTPWTLSTLIMRGMPRRITDAVDALTRRKRDDETYVDYIERVALNPLARLVKIEDLKDHLWRIDSLPDYQADRLRPRYHAALQRLLEVKS